MGAGTGEHHVLLSANENTPRSQRNRVVKACNKLLYLQPQRTVYNALGDLTTCPNTSIRGARLLTALTSLEHSRFTRQTTCLLASSERSNLTIQMRPCIRRQPGNGGETKAAEDSERQVHTSDCSMLGKASFWAHTPPSSPTMAAAVRQPPLGSSHRRWSSTYDCQLML